MSQVAPPGLLELLTRLGSSLFSMVQNRLELASLEVGEAGERLVLTIVACFAAVLLLFGAVATLSVWVAFALWGTLGPAVLGWLALAHGLAGVGALWWLRARLRAAPPLLAATLAELRADSVAMRGETPSHGDGEAR